MFTFDSCYIEDTAREGKYADKYVIYKPLRSEDDVNNFKVNLPSRIVVKVQDSDNGNQLVDKYINFSLNNYDTTDEDYMNALGDAARPEDHDVDYNISLSCSIPSELQGVVEEYQLPSSLDIVLLQQHPINGIKFPGQVGDTYKITIPYGTDRADAEAKLPKTCIGTKDGAEKFTDYPVKTWTTTGTYNKEGCTLTYKPTIELTANITYLPGSTPALDAIVGTMEVLTDNVIVSIDEISEGALKPEFASINVLNGVTEIEAKKLLPKKLTAHLDNDTTIDIQFTEWTTTDAYNETDGGSFVYTGTLAALPAKVIDKDNLIPASIKSTLKVAAFRKVLSFTAPTDINVAFNTEEAEAKAQLPTKLTIKVEGNIDKEVNITSFTANSPYDKNGGDFVYTAVLDNLPAQVQDTDNVLQNVTCKIKVAFKQYDITTIEPVENITVVNGTEKEAAETKLPTVIKATLDDSTKRDIPVKFVTTDTYNPQGGVVNYTGVATLPEHVTDSKGLLNNLTIKITVGQVLQHNIQLQQNDDKGNILKLFPKTVAKMVYVDDKTLTEVLSTLATKSYTDDKLAELIANAPEALDTLKELAAALGNDPNFATTVATQIGKKADKSYVDEKLSVLVGSSLYFEIIPDEAPTPSI